MRYRRAYAPGDTFFFTVVTESRQPILTSPEAIATLREAFRTAKTARPFDIDAIVILPDHLHCIWTLPPDDTDFSTRWRLLKTWFTKHCSSEYRAPLTASRRAKQQQAIWQHRYWEHQIRDQTNDNRHVASIHYNPVKHAHVSAPGEWPHSSFHRYVAAGVYSADWGSTEINYENIGHE